MLAPLATIAFLAGLWLVARLALDMVEGDGAKIAAALRGRSMLAQPVQSVRPVSVRFQPVQSVRPVSVRFQPRAGSVRRPLRARPEWRAAA